MAMNKKNKERRMTQGAPPSPCSYGCLPCNIYCFVEVVKRTTELRKRVQEMNERNKQAVLVGLNGNRDGNAARG